ncbi:MAG TPA: TatD family nuclease-associated radical SAM protein [Acidiferrobacter sp.]|nr:TatD family nuclease-associated radical SAM protein [Acidiferrobacter sp.]
METDAGLTGRAQIPRPGAVFAYRLRNAVYLNVTSRCTLRCRFCPKFHKVWTVDTAYLRLSGLEEPSAAELIAAARTEGPCDEFVFCGLGEPTTRLAVVLEVASVLRAGGTRVRLNTDGLASLVHGRDVAPELAGLVDHVSISLNAHNETLYRYLCRPQIPGSFQAMLAFADRCRQFVPRVTMTAIEGLDGVDVEACAAVAHKIGVEFRSRPLESTDGRTFRVR